MFYHYLLIYFFCKIICIHCEWVEIQQNNQETKNNDEKLSIIKHSDFIGSVLKQNNTFDMGRSQLLNEPQMINVNNNKSKRITPESLAVIPKLIKRSDQFKTIHNFQFSIPEFRINRNDEKSFKSVITKTKAKTTKKPTTMSTTMSIPVESKETDSEIMSKIRGTALYDKIKTLKNKLSYLAELRQEILDTISHKLDDLWPKRRKRDFMQGDNHMDFPSAEGALMTISFLTFAVFLIKLVLQVINTIKSKHYSFNGFDAMPMGTVNVVKKNRYSREVLHSENNLNEMTKILNAIEKLKV